MASAGDNEELRRSGGYAEVLRRKLAMSAEPSHPHAYPPIETVSGRLGGGAIDEEGGAANTETRTPPGTMFPQYLACFASTLGGFVMGTTIGWSGPAIQLIRESVNASSQPDSEFPGQYLHSFPVDDAAANWVGSLMPVGGLLGGLLAGYLIRKIGRRTTMFFMSAWFALAYLVLAAAQNVWMLFVGRVLCGLGTGVSSIATNLYLAETASPEVRGMLGTCFQVMVTLGVLFVDALALAVSWRWLSVCCIAACLVWISALCFVPDSPVYLLTQKKFDEARLSLQFLRGHPYIETELSEMQSSIESSSNHVASYSDLFTQSQNQKPLLISMMLMLGQQLSGINAVLFFSVLIFDDAGTSLNSFVESTIVAAVMVATTVVVALLVDKLGRKFLLVFSSLFMAVGNYGLGTYFYYYSHDPALAKSISFLPLASMSLFIFAFSVGFGPMPWLLLGELFGPETKEKASGISASFNWMLGFLVTQFFGPLNAAFGTEVTFWLFASIMVFMLAFCAFFVPETKGRSLEEIQQMFRIQARQEESSRDGEEDRNRLIVDAEPDQPLDDQVAGEA